MSKYLKKIHGFFSNALSSHTSSTESDDKTSDGNSQQLINLRKDCLHTTDADAVFKRLTDLFSSGEFSEERLLHGNNSAINELKYFARLHGLPCCFVSRLYGSVRTAQLTPSQNEDTNYLTTFKIVLALKYAVIHNHDFIPLTDLLVLLFDVFPLVALSTMSSDNFLRQEIISQLLLTIITILKPGRISQENISHEHLRKLENYLGYINGKYKGDVRRCLENLGYTSGTFSYGHLQSQQGMDGHHHHSNNLLPTGDHITPVHQKSIAAHVVKTQQTEALTTEENVSEKTQMSNISLSQALEQGRTRTIEAARERETLDPPKSAQGSDRSWYKTTSTEINHFLKKAKGNGAISPDDVQYLRNKFNGFKFSFSQSYPTMILMIAEIFYLITKYQELNSTIMEELLQLVAESNFDNDEARQFVLKAIDRYCIRLGCVPWEIHNNLQKLVEKNRAKCNNKSWMSLANEILFSDDSYVTESLRHSVESLKYKTTCVEGLDYIQRQITIQSRRGELEKRADLLPNLLAVISEYSVNLSYDSEEEERRRTGERSLQLIATAQTALSSVAAALNTISSNFTENKNKKYSNMKIVEKALDVLEDYLQLNWTTGLVPNHIDTLVDVARNSIANEFVLEKSIRCILRSTEKSIPDGNYWQQISLDQKTSHFTLLFMIASSGENRLLRIFTLITLAKILNMNSLEGLIEFVQNQHVEQWIQQLIRKDIILGGRGDADRKVVLEEDLTGDGPSEDHEYVSDYISQILVILAQQKCKFVDQDLIISALSQTFLNSKSKNTRISCSEFFYWIAVNSNAVFSVPVLNQIQGEAVSSIGDIRVYCSAAFCISLAKQVELNRRLKTEHVNFLVNLYSSKDVKLDGISYSAHINPNILKVFHAACRTGIEVSEEVFHLLALTLNNTCADNEDSREYAIVKSILDTVTAFCEFEERQAETLPGVIVEAVENLLLESDIFEKACAGVVEKCMVNGRWISDTVVEMFAKYLLEEPHISIPYLRRLLLASENQDLPDSIFTSVQMDFIGLRLLPIDIYAEGAALLQYNNLDNGGDTVQLFRRLAQYVHEGMLLSKLNFEVIAKLLLQSNSKLPRNEIIQCLTNASSNGQCLPKELINLSLKLDDDKLDSSCVQLDFAASVIQRGQQIPEHFQSHIFQHIDQNADLYLTERSHRILQFLKTMILHNEQLPPHVVQQYCATVWNNKETMTTADVLSSLIKLVDRGQVNTKNDISACKEVFLFALKDQNSTVADIGAKGLLALPNDKETQEIVNARSRQLQLNEQAYSNIPTKIELLLAIQSYVNKNANIQCGTGKQTPIWRETLEKFLSVDFKFGKNVGKSLMEREGPLIDFEDMILESLCSTLISNKTAEPIRRHLRNTIEKILKKRRVTLNSTCRSYLASGYSGNKNWARQILKCGDPTGVVTALAHWSKQPNEVKTGEVLGRLLSNVTICRDYNREIMKTINNMKPQQWRDVPNITNAIAISMLGEQSLITRKFAVKNKKFKKYVELLEEQLCYPTSHINPLVLEAYAEVLKQFGVNVTTKWELCAISLVTYVCQNINTLKWFEKRHIFEIFDKLAYQCPNLPEALLRFVYDGVFSKDDVYLRGNCFKIFRTLFHPAFLPSSLPSLFPQWQTEMEHWIRAFHLNLYTVYHQLYGVVEEEDLEETEFSLDLVSTLHTLSVLDLEGIKKKKEHEWILSLMVTETLESMTTSFDEQVKLYPIAKKFCSYFTHNPLLRLNIMTAAKDYVKDRSGTVSIARVLEFIISLLEEENEEMKKGELEEYETAEEDEGEQEEYEEIEYSRLSERPWINNWMDKVISKSLTSSLYNKLNQSSALSWNLVEVTLELPLTFVPIKILDQIILSLVPGKTNLNEMKALFNFITSHKISSSIIETCLNKQNVDLLVSLETAVILSHLPKGATESIELFTEIEKHVTNLLQKDHDYFQIDRLFEMLSDSVNKNLLVLNQGLAVLENILNQLVTYQLSHQMFTNILNLLKGKEIIEWVSSCNRLVMENLYSGSRGVKTAAEIAEEFKRLNRQHTPLCLDNFSELINEIQSGNFFSALEEESPLPISDWKSPEIQMWATKTQGRMSEDLLKEAVAVISKACFLTRNYRLTPIQILSVYATMMNSEEKGKLLQVATGSGKSTIIATLSVIQCLKGFSVDVYTSSPVLAVRDAKAWGPFYKLFGLTCDHNGDKGSGYLRGEKYCYRKNIVYGDTSQFQFDTLRHEYSGLGTRGSRLYEYAVVDEVDSMMVDDSSKLARLSCTIPGMDMLQILYHFIWRRLHDMRQKLYTVGNDTYSLEGLCRRNDNGTMCYSYADQEDAGRLKEVTDLYHFVLEQNEVALERAHITKVADVETFFKDRLKEYIQILIGTGVSKESSSKSQTFPLPKYLISFATSQVQNWVDSAITAVAFQENVHYIVDSGQIKPVDFHTTGIIQALTNWNNGLHQFLQIKHSLKVTTETVTTNFLSNMAMFQKYKANLVGFTGTLGSQFGQDVLKSVYNVMTLIIPELHYKRFQLLRQTVKSSKFTWIQGIVQSSLHESAKGRAVLVICQTIRDADAIAKYLETKTGCNGGYQRAAVIKVYTRNDQNQEKFVESVNAGDIIVATNLAGRGTDINTSKIEDHGGLHVILTFLPDSLRVEEQAFGRTARQGNKGSGEIIVCGVTTDSFEQLKTERDKGEESRLNDFKSKDLLLIQTKDKLFSKFCQLYSRIRTEFTNSLKAGLGMEALTPVERIRLNAIEHPWAVLLKQLDDGDLSPEEADAAYSEFEQNVNNTYEDVGTAIAASANCFYWIQLGNDYYCRSNKISDNAGKALGYFNKGVETDPDFAAGGYAGIGFCLLKGKYRYILKDSHSDNYKVVAMQQFDKALKLLYTEISFYMAVQSLVMSRGCTLDSGLCRQLEEKVNLVGEYANYIEGIKNILEKSLRRVYLTEIYSLTNTSRRWELDVNDPTMDKFKSTSATYTLEFHDLTRYNDGGDQATKTLHKYDNATITVHNQDLEKLITGIEKVTHALPLLQLDNVAGVEGVIRLRDILGVRGTYVLKMRSVRRQILDDFAMIETLTYTRIEVTWEEEEGTRQHKMWGVCGSRTFQAVPENTDLTVELEVSDNQDVSWLSSVLNENITLSAVFRNLDDVTIRETWSNGVLSAFNNNTVSFVKFSNKIAKDLIDALRKEGITFELRLECLNYQQAVTALKNSDREQEDIEERTVKKMGHQFSSSYVPLDLVRELLQRGITLMPEFMEKAFIPWRSIAYLCLLSSVQIGVGAALIYTGFGSTVGMGLVTEGLADFTMAYRAYSTRHFSWKDYASQKAISLLISAISVGYQTAKSGAKATPSLLQGVINEVEEQVGTNVLSRGGRETLKEAGAQLRTLAAQQLQVIETTARVGLNTAAEAVAEFTFDSVRDELINEIEITVSREFRLPEFIQYLRICVVMDSGGLLPSKIVGWMNEVTNPQSKNWNQAWDTVGYPMCQGILSDSRFLGSVFSITARLVGIIHGSTEIATITKRVCDHIKNKLKLECEGYTPAYVLERDFGLTPEQIEHLVAQIEFEDSTTFYVRRFPTLLDSDLRENFVAIKRKFQSLHESIDNFTPETDKTSRMIRSVSDRLTTHVIHVANGQLVSPIATAAAGKLVETISKEIQSKYLANEIKSLDEQKKLSGKGDGKTKWFEPGNEFLGRLARVINPNNRSDIINEKIQQDFTGVYQNRDRVRDIIRCLTSIKTDIPRETVNTLNNILNGEPADITILLLLAKLNNVAIKLVDNPLYVPTTEDKKLGLRIGVVEKRSAGRYTVVDPALDNTADAAGSREYHCAYQAMSLFTRTKNMELRLQVASYIALNPDEFRDIDEHATWIRDRFPEQPANHLYIGERRNTDFPRVAIADVDNLRRQKEYLDRWIERRVTMRSVRGIENPAVHALVTKETISNVVMSSAIFTLEKADGTPAKISAHDLSPTIVAGYMNKGQRDSRGLLLTKSTNKKIYKDFENRCYNFLMSATAENLVEHGDILLKQKYTIGQVDQIILDDSVTKIPMATDITCTAYLQTFDHMQEEKRDKVVALFKNVFEAPPHCRCTKTNEVSSSDLSGYTAKFTNRGESGRLDTWKIYFQW